LEDEEEALQLIVIAIAIHLFQAISHIPFCFVSWPGRLKYFKLAPMKMLLGSLLFGLSTNSLPTPPCSLLVSLGPRVVVEFCVKIDFD